MAVKARKKKVVVDEMAKFEKIEIEFLFEVIREAMIPGKYLPIATKTVDKLRAQYQLLDRKDRIIKKEMTQEEVLQEKIFKAQKEVAKTKQIDGELYMEMDE